MKNLFKKMLGRKNKIDGITKFDFGNIDLDNKTVRFNNGFSLIDIYCSKDIDGKAIVNRYNNSRLSTEYLFCFINGWSNK